MIQLSQVQWNEMCFSTSILRNGCFDGCAFHQYFPYSIHLASRKTVWLRYQINMSRSETSHSVNTYEYVICGLFCLGHRLYVCGLSSKDWMVSEVLPHSCQSVLSDSYCIAMQLLIGPSQKYPPSSLWYSSPSICLRLFKICFIVCQENLKPELFKM